MKLKTFYINSLKIVPVPVSCELASSQTSEYETDPPQADNFEHLKCSCAGAQMRLLLQEYSLLIMQDRLLPLVSAT